MMTVIVVSVVVLAAVAVTTHWYMGLAAPVAVDPFLEEGLARQAVYAARAQVVLAEARLQLAAAREKEAYYASLAEKIRISALRVA